MAGEFERLAYEAALRSLDKQEGYVEELRARTGILLAASSLAASLPGQQAFQAPSPRGLVIGALLVFVISIGMDIFILLPRQDLIFTQEGTGLYEELFPVREDMSEVYRYLTYDLNRLWKENDATIRGLIQAFTVAAAALVIETLILATLLGGNILSS